MATITVWNKGKREWQLKNAEGKIVKVNPQESIEMEEGEGRRYCMDYPRDLSTTGIAGPSASDLARREQSLKDREANMAAKEKALDEREKAVKAREDALKGDEKTALLEEAKALGLDLDGRMKTGKIKEAIEGKKKAIAEGK